jgi:hypothetical protein
MGPSPIPEFEPVMPWPSDWVNGKSPPPTALETAMWSMPNYPSIPASTSPSSICEQGLSLASASYSFNSVSVSNSTTYNCYYNFKGGGPYLFGSSVKLQSYVCPSGYALVGAVCTLNNAAAVPWPADGVPTTVATSNSSTPQPAPPDPDPQTTASSASSIEGIDSNNNPTNIAADADSLTISTQDTSGVQQDTYIFNEEGDVTQYYYNYYDNASLSDVTAGTAAPVTTTALDTTGLATEATLQEVNSKLEKDISPMPPIDDAETFEAATQRFIDAVVVKISLPEFDIPSSECPIYKEYVPFINLELKIDQHCQLESVVRPIIELTMLAFWSILAFTILLKA